jgi:hypothetical protein
LGDRIENRESAIGSTRTFGGSDYCITEGVSLVRRNSEAAFIEAAAA